MNLSRLGLSEIIEVICKVMKVSQKALISETQDKAMIARALVTYYAHYFGGYQLNRVALMLLCEPEILSNIMHKTISSSSKNEQISGWMKAIEDAFWFKLIELNLSG